MAFIRDDEAELKAGRFRNFRDYSDAELRYDYSLEYDRNSSALLRDKFEEILDVIDDMDCLWTVGIVRLRRLYRVTIGLPSYLEAVELKLRMP